MFLWQESVEVDDVTVGYIESHDNSISAVVSSADEVVMTSNTAVAFSNMQHPHDGAMLQQTSPTALAVNLTTSPELPTFEPAASKYACVHISCYNISWNFSFFFRNMSL